MPYDVVEISQRLIRCASVTPADDGAQDVLIDLLEPLGFTAQDYSAQGIRNTVFTLDFGAVPRDQNATNGAASKPLSSPSSQSLSEPSSKISSKTAPHSKPHLCFAGHTDVVPVGNIEDWSVDPFGAEIKDGVLYGRGACDMKTGITAFVAALSDFLSDENKAALPTHGTISLLITGDEEAVAEYGTKHVLEELRKEGRVPDVALVGEPTNPKAAGDEIKVGRRGSLTGIIKVDGTQGHVAYPEKADNPLPKLLKLCSALEEHIFDEGNDYFPATNLEFVTIDTGNTADNVIPATARAQFNVRFNNHWSAITLEAKIREILNACAIEGYDLTTKSNAESFLTQEGEWTNIVRDAVQHVTGRMPELSTKGGTSDARFITNYCPVVEYGLINSSAHEVDEYMPLSAMHDAVAIYAEILRQYFTI